MWLRNPDEDLRELERQAEAEGRDSRVDLQYLRACLRLGKLPEQHLTQSAKLGDKNSQRLLSELRRHNRLRFRKSKLITKNLENFGDTLRSEHLTSEMPTKFLIYWISDMLKLILRDIASIRTGKGGLIFPKPSEIQRSALEILNLMAPYEELTKNHDLSNVALAIREKSYPIRDIIVNARKLCQMAGGIERIYLSYRERVDGFLQIAICNLAQAAVCQVTQGTRHECDALTYEDYSMREMGAVPSDRPWRIMPVYGQTRHITEAAEAIDELFHILIPRLFRPSDNQILRDVASVNKLLMRRREEHLQLLADILLGREWNRPTKTA